MARLSALKGKFGNALEFEGVIDEVLIFDKAFSPNEVSDLMNPSPIEALDKLTAVWGDLKK